MFTLHHSMSSLCRSCYGSFWLLGDFLWCTATHKSVSLEMPRGKRKDQGLQSLCVSVVELTLLQTPNLWSAEIAGATASLRWQMACPILPLLFTKSHEAKSTEHLSTGDSSAPLTQCSCGYWVSLHKSQMGKIVL